MKCIFFKGWLKSETMKEQGINLFNLWYKTATEVEKENFQLVIFKVYTDDKEVIQQIEKLLQDKKYNKA